MQGATMRQPISFVFALISLLLGSLAVQPLAATTPHGEARTQLCAGAAASGFTDVSGVHASNIACVFAFGVTQGTSDTTFNPHGPLRRDHLATLLTNFLARATGATYEPPTANPFVDVGQSVHADSIAIAAQQNLTNGITATRFAPQRHVTRDQFASLLLNTLTAAGHVLPETHSNTFADLAANVHATNIGRLAAAGIVSGATPQRFDPNTPVTRQQAATLLINAAAELHLAELWAAGPLGQNETAPSQPANPQATVTVTQVALNGITLSPTETNTASNDPLIVTGQATADESTIVNVQARIDDGPWLTATALSGTFDSAEEAFQIVLQDIPDGARQLTLRAIDADGLSSTLVTFNLAVNKPAVAVVVSAVTDPAQDRIIITFDQAVSCVNTPNGRAAWQFANQSLHAPVLGQASGTPDTISPLNDDPTVCALNYTTSGIRVSDFGTLSYTRPDVDDAVRTDSGQLGQTAGLKVVDGFAPSLVSITVDSTENEKAIFATFSEPMQCRSFGQSDFWIAVSGVTNDFTIASVQCSAGLTSITILLSEFEFTPGMQVNFAIVNDIFDASGDNKAPAPVTASTTAS